MQQTYVWFSIIIPVLFLNQLAINQAIREADEEDEDEDEDEDEGEDEKKEKEINIPFEKEPALQRTRNRPKRVV